MYLSVLLCTTPGKDYPLTLVIMERCRVSRPFLELLMQLISLRSLHRSGGHSPGSAQRRQLNSAGRPHHRPPWRTICYRRWPLRASW